MAEEKIKSYKSMSCQVFQDYNVVFDEKGSSCGVLRKVQWIPEGGEMDENKAKLEIRKIYNNASGEKSGKGYTFSTEEGPDELVVGLIDAGFGNTGDIIVHVKKREDFVDTIQSIRFEDSTVQNVDGEVFDLRDLLLKEDDEDAEAV